MACHFCCRAVDRRSTALLNKSVCRRWQRKAPTKCLRPHRHCHASAAGPSTLGWRCIARGADARQRMQESCLVPGTFLRRTRTVRICYACLPSMHRLPILMHVTIPCLLH